MTLSGFLIMVVFLCMFFMLISSIMMARYLWKRRLIPRWKLITGFMDPDRELNAYITNTKQEYGHVGIWVKIFFGSFGLAIIIAIFMAISGQ